MKTSLNLQSRMFAHEDLPLFTGQAPKAKLPEPRPTVIALQMVLLPYRVYPHRPLIGYTAIDCFDCGAGDQAQIPFGSEVEIMRSGKTTDRILIRTIDHKLYAWIDRCQIFQG